MFQTDVLQQMTKGFDANSKVYMVLSAFAETMLEPMVERYSLYPAKGTTDVRYAHNSDQMMLTHILNGLLPTLILVYEAQKRCLPRLSRLEVEELKVYVLAYSMHDLDKILNEGEKFGTRTRAATANAYQKTIAELERLNARAFLPTVENWVSEILWLAVNTQRSRDINLSHATFIPYEDTHLNDEVIETFRPQTQRFRTRIEPTLRDLCTLSDLIAYFVKSPEDALLSNAATRSGGLLDLIRQLTDDGIGNTLTLAYHKLAEVRGLLSNQVNNAVIRYLLSLDIEEDARLIPYLYFPNGVVYLDPQNRRISAFDPKAIHTAVRREIQASCREVIAGGLGFGFDPKSLLKYPRYVHDFLTVREFLNLFIEKTLSESGPHVAGSTLQRSAEKLSDHPEACLGGK